MNRGLIIGALCHFYPAFVILHLVLGDWCKRCQLMFNCVPIIVFSGLFYVWCNTSENKLSAGERISIGYLAYSIILVSIYYCICVVSTSKWVYAHNTQFAGFCIFTIIYYLYELQIKNV